MNVQLSNNATAFSKSAKIIEPLPVEQFSEKVVFFTFK